MADVLIVCVREDEPQAKALADMFEGAGFSIGGAPNNDAALRSSGAGIIVWSQASIRSRPFLDAAQRVMNAGKAVVASLIEPPPPSSIGDSPAFDLSNWGGDPEDAALDPLFFAVDRLVSAARASVGVAAAAAEPARAEYTPPARPQPQPPPRRAAPLQSAPAADPLDSEAALWRSIRNSRDPAVFLDYLARFGPDGEFSDVAELRLRQLTAASDARAPRAAPPPPRREAAPRLEPRLEPPPRRPDPPPRRPDPPMRPAEAAPPRRRDPPEYERRYERVEAREPKSEGGALRAIVMVGLLGGAALVGALYLGGGRSSDTRPQSEQAAEVAAPLEPSAAPEAGGASDAAPEPAPSTRLEALVTSQERPVREERARPERPRQEEEEPEPPTPAPTTNWTAASGPTPLAPPAATSAIEAPVPRSVATASIDPPDLAPRPAATTPTPAPPPGQVRWAQRPSANSIATRYPERAAAQNIGGRVVMDCLIGANLAVTCSLVSETPAGMGFGRAALAAAGGYRAQPLLSNGASAVGSRTRVSIQFMPAR